MWHYARGLAYAATGNFTAAEAERSALDGLAAQIPPGRIVGDNQPAGLLLRVASLTLAGGIAARQGHCESALPKLDEAGTIPDGLPYTEPPPWYSPVRQALGTVLLQCDRPETAATVFAEDLRRNPDNGWSLYGYAAALRAMNQPDAAAAGARFRSAWKNADVQLTAARL